MQKLYLKNGAIEPDPSDLYGAPDFPLPPEDKPYVFINMASTVDGKILMGDIGSSSKGVGSPTDRQLMHRIEALADGVIIGAATLRVDGKMRYPRNLKRAVCTRDGDLPLSAGFFHNCEETAVVISVKRLSEERRQALQTVAELALFGDDELDLVSALRYLRQKKNINYLLCEGGGEFNAAMFRAGVVDELFLTISPKIRGGRHIPTIVEGMGFVADVVPHLELLSVYEHESELYLRYLVKPDNKTASALDEQV